MSVRSGQWKSGILFRQSAQADANETKPKDAYASAYTTSAASLSDIVRLQKEQLTLAAGVVLAGQEGGDG